jgi:hypothetical protein
VSFLSQGILEKLSLAEPPWKQDDVLYSNYPPDRPEGRPPTYRSSQQGRPEGRTGASAGAPAYMRAPEYEPRRPSAYEPPGTAAYKDPRMPAYERAAERPRREAANPYERKGVVSYREESETLGSREASFREPRQTNRGYPVERERAFAGGARSPVASERRASEVGASGKRVRGQEGVSVQRRASSERDSSPGPPRETGVRRDAMFASRPQEAGDSERGLEWSAAVQVSRGPEAEPIYAERGFPEGAGRSSGLVRGSRFERPRPEAGANFTQSAFLEREPAREPTLGPATVGSSFGVQNSGVNHPPEGRNGLSSQSTREPTGFRGEPARATAGTSSETSALRGVNGRKYAERPAGSEGAWDGSVENVDVTELRESRFGDEPRATLLRNERVALERPGVKRAGAPSDIREASPLGDAATRGGRFTERDDWGRGVTGGDSDRGRGSVRRDAEREFGPLGRAAGREGDPTEWISDSGRGFAGADRQRGFAGWDSAGVQARVNGDSFAVGEAASYSDQMRSFPPRAGDVGSLPPPNRAGSGDSSSGASGSFSQRPEKLPGYEEAAGGYGKDPNRPVAPGSRSQVGSARERPLQGSTQRYGSVGSGSEQRLQSRDVASRILSAERPGWEDNEKRDPGNRAGAGTERRAVFAATESRMSGVPLGQSARNEDGAQQPGRPPLPRESRGRSVERVPGMESAAPVLDEDELTLDGSQQTPARARPFRERVERGSS